MTTAPTSHRRQAGLELALALAGKTAASLGSVGLAALAPFVRDEFGLSAAGVGAIMSAIFLGALAATVPAGRLTDRVAAGRMLAVSLLALAGALVVTATAPAAPVFFLGVLLAGLAFGSADPGTNVLVNASVSRRNRGLVMGVKQTGMTVGGLLGGLVLPPLAEAASWRLAIAVPFAVCLAVAVFGLRIPATPPEIVERRAAEGVDASPPLGMRAYGFVMAGVQLTVMGYLAIYLVDEIDMSETTAGVAIAVALAGATAGRVAWGILSDRILHSRLVALQLAAIGALFALVVLSLVGGEAVLWPLLFVLGFCSIGWNGVYMTVAAESVPLSSVGRATGMALFFSYAGALVLPPAFGAIVDGTDSWTATWLAAAAAIAVVLAAFRVTARRLQARAALG